MQYATALVTCVFLVLVKARVYTEDIQVTHGIFHGLPSPGPGCSKGG